MATSARRRTQTAGKVVTQVVDGNWGVHAIIRKELFAARDD
jgi:hypothetical protein